MCVRLTDITAAVYLDSCSPEPIIMYLPLTKCYQQRFVAVDENPERLVHAVVRELVRGIS